MENKDDIETIFFYDMIFFGYEGRIPNLSELETQFSDYKLDSGILTKEQQKELYRIHTTAKSLEDIANKIEINHNIEIDATKIFINGQYRLLKELEKEQVKGAEEILENEFNKFYVENEIEKYESKLKDRDLIVDFLNTYGQRTKVLKENARALIRNLPKEDIIEELVDEIHKWK